ncbi:MAG: GAF domain-containing protein, partial [Anaerolineae bacterium]|nr:GAF domain-containing protein [Anaerolineae bacterium]
RLAWIGLIEEGHQRVIPAARAGQGTDYLDQVTITWDESETGQGPTGTAIRTRHPAECRNMAIDPRYAPWREAALAHGFGSSVAVPMVYGEQLFGTVTVYADQPEAFDEEEIGLLSELASDMAFALQSAEDEAERKQAEEALRQRTRSLALINQANHAFSSTLDPNQVLAIALEETRRLLDIAASSIWLVDPETQELVCRQATGPKYESVVGWRLAPGEGIAGWVATHGESLIVPDAEKDTRHAADVNQHIGLKVHSILSIPLRTKQSVIGVLQMLDVEAGRFDAEDLQVLEPLAASAAIAIENARLYQQAQQEVEERKQAEEALAAERTLLRTIVDILPALVYAKDTACRKFLSNRVDLEYMGASTEAEVLGKTDSDFYPEDMAARFYARDQAIIQTGQPLIDYEHTIIMADGQQRWLLTSKVPLRDSAGQVIGLVGVGQDITERKRAEETLRESEEKYRNVVERANDGITIIQDSLVRYANLRLAEMWGGSVEEVIGTRFADYVDPDELSKVVERYTQRVAGESVTPIYETVLRRRNGEKVHVELNAGTIAYQGEPADLVIIRDITERKQAEVALQHYVERLRILRAIDGIVLAAQSPQEIGRAVSRHLQRLAPSDRVLVSSFDLEKGKATVLASLAGDGTWLEAGAQIGLEAFGSIEDLQAGRVSIVGDAQALEETSLGQSGTLLEGGRSYLHIPLIAQGELVGSLLLVSEHPAAFTTEHVEIAGELSGQLAIGIHQARLRDQVRRHAAELEQQVAVRTAQLARRTTQLQVAAKVARDATTARDLDELLTRSVSLVRDRFGFYHAGIFLTDEHGEYAVLQAATGEAGRQMLEHGHRLEVGKVGIVGYVTGTGEPRIALDAGADAVHFDNPFLPETRSEMALPLRVGRNVIGALDVQSTKESAFDQDDVEIMQVMADQLAVAIEKTRLFERVQATLEERLRTVISNVPIVLFALDREGVFTLSEGKGLEALGLKPGEHVGQSSLDLYRDAPGILEDCRRALAGEVVTSIREQAGSTFEAWYSPLRDESGEISGVIGVATDVTERSRLQEQVQRQERLAAVGQLAGGIAHDFNNFLMTIIFYAHLLLRDKDLSPDIVSVAETIVGEANRAAALVRQVLDFSRRSVMDTQPVDLVSFVEEVMDILQKTLPENIQVVTEMGSDDYTVEIDPTRIQQVIMNLALNSRDAMPNGGNLRIELSRVTVDSIGMHSPGIPDLELAAGNWVCLSVQDTGTGMDGHVRAHLFEPFFTTKGPKGNGLGLAQVYGIVKQHRGEIGVETELGHGTTFRIYLPAYRRNDAEVTTAEEAPAIPEGRGETILFVEDEERVRDAGQRVLQSLGYCVLTASNGKEGLDAFRKADKVDLVLTDMVMPEMGGRELIQELKQISPGLKTLVITGYTMQEDIQALKEAGFADVIYKPIDVGILGRTIRRILDAGADNG